jgi:hypothetical protein
MIFIVLPAQGTEGSSRREESIGSYLSVSRDWRSLERDEALGLAASSAKTSQVGLHFAIQPERFGHRIQNQSRRRI